MSPEQVMEGMAEVKNPPRDDIAEITRSSRDLPPAHFTYKIENFSLFSLAKIDNVESGDFEVDSYKWYVGIWPQMVSSSLSEFIIFFFFSLIKVFELQEIMSLS